MLFYIKYEYKIGKTFSILALYFAKFFKSKSNEIFRIKTDDKWDII